jgi:hypothetical protein
VRRRTIKRGHDRQWVAGKDVHLAEEVRYIQRWAAARDGRIVTIGPLLLFSTAGGDAWLLDPADRLATRIAQDGDPLPVHIDETKTSFAIGWQGHYDIAGDAFIFNDTESGRVTTILGYPTRRIIEQISNMFG